MRVVRFAYLGWGSGGTTNRPLLSSARGGTYAPAVKNTACWASSLGACSAKISREHIISASQFGGAKAITLSGLPWCPKPKTVGLASLVANNLCSKHNSDLSPVDAEAAKFRDALGAFIEPHLIPVAHHLDARLIERWLLKTTINIALQGKPPDIDVTVDLVRAAFGVEPPPAGKGFFFVAELGDRIPFQGGQLRFETMIRKDTRKIALSFFSFHGSPLLYAFPGAPQIRGASRLRECKRDEGDRIQLVWRPPLPRNDHVMPPTNLSE